MFEPVYSTIGCLAICVALAPIAFAGIVYYLPRLAEWLCDVFSDMGKGKVN